MLAEYDKIVPRGAGRLVAMAESQMAHRHQLETRVIDSNIRASRWGQVFGFVICMTTILGGFYLVAHGSDVSGMAAIITALGVLIGVFVYGRKREEKERAAKEQNLPAQLR